MDDARPQIAIRVAQLGKAREQAIDQRAALVARRRVDDDAGRLVDHDHRRIFEHHLERDLVLGGRRSSVRAPRGAIETRSPPVTRSLGLAG